MKQLQLVGALIVCLMSAASAQITIESTDMPSPGLIFVTSNGVVQDLINPDTTGANFSWDFGNLSRGIDRSDTLLATTALPLTLRFIYNNATYAGPVTNLPEGFEAFGVESPYEFYRVSGTEMVSLGSAALLSNLPLKLAYTPTPDRLYKFPLNFQNTDSNNVAALVEVPGFGSYKQTLKRKTFVDGWGKVTTPTGTFDALRVKYLIDRSDTLSQSGQVFFGAEIKIKEYRWLTKVHKVPVLTITVFEVPDSIGESTIQFSYLKNQLTAIEKNELVSSIAIVGNSLTDQIEVSIPNSNQFLKATLLNLSGQQLVSKSGYNNCVLDCSRMSAGVYILTVETDSGMLNRKVFIGQ
jgi:hypothetical protein